MITKEANHIIRLLETTSMTAAEFGAVFSLKQLAVYRSSNKLKWNSYHTEVINRLIPYLKKCKVDFNNEIIDPDCPIWSFWDSGFEKAPDIVKLCQDSRHRYKGTHQIMDVCLENITSFIDLPQKILDLLTSNQISMACFADYVRLSLLSKYGGIWSDATVLFTDVPFYIKQDDKFYSVRYPVNNPKYISKGNWAVWYLACGKSNVIANVCREAFEFYWKDHNVLIDYFMFDYIIEILKSMNLEAQNQLARIRSYDWNPYCLQEIINNGNLSSIKLSSTRLGPLQKLNYRIPVSSRNINKIASLIS